MSSYLYSPSPGDLQDFAATYQHTTRRSPPSLRKTTQMASASRPSTAPSGHLGMTVTWGSQVEERGSGQASGSWGGGSDPRNSSAASFTRLSHGSLSSSEGEDGEEEFDHGAGEEEGSFVRGVWVEAATAQAVKQLFQDECGSDIGTLLETVAMICVPKEEVAHTGPRTTRRPRTAGEPRARTRRPPTLVDPLEESLPRPVMDLPGPQATLVKRSVRMGGGYTALTGTAVRR